MQEAGTARAGIGNLATASSTKAPNRRNHNARVKGCTEYKAVQNRRVLNRLDDTQNYIRQTVPTRMKELPIPQWATAGYKKLI